MRTTTSIDSARVRVTAGQHGSILTELRAATPWAPRPLPPHGPVARVALAQTTATLIGGDEIALDVDVEAGAALELVETSATVAHHARGGPPASVHVRVQLGAGARLRWLAQPLVLANGCDVERTCEISLAAGARALLRETLVLGRSDERPGTLHGRLTATYDARTLLVEQFDTDEPALLRSPIVAGNAATLDTLYLFGTRGEDLPGTSQLHGPGTVWRALTPRTIDPDTAAAPAVTAWTTELAPEGKRRSGGRCHPARPSLSQGACRR